MMDDTLGMDDVRNFEIMLEAYRRGLYLGCKKSETLLAFVIRMLHVKVHGDFGLVSSNENTGDDGDDETSVSPTHMVTHINRGKRSRHACSLAVALAQATPAHPPVTRSSHLENTADGVGQATPAQLRVTQSSHVDSTLEVATIARVRSPTRIAIFSSQPDQVLTPHTDGSSVASASSEGSRHVGGKTRGLKVEKLRRQFGHTIPISIPALSLAPEGEFATSFANLLGEAIRDEAPIRKEG